MSVIIRLQNLPWSANALDIRNFFRGLSIPEGGVHIVGGELGDAFIAFSTDEDARQGFMLNGGKIKEIQVKLMLSSRSEMHKVIEAARQSVPILSLAPAAPAPAPAPAPVPVSTPGLLNQHGTIPGITSLPQNMFASFGIPGLGGVLDMPQPAVIEPPTTNSPIIITNPNNDQQATNNNGDRMFSKDRNSEKDRRRTKSKSRSRSRDRKDRKRDRRDRSRSRERRRRERSRSRDRDRDRKDRRRDRQPRSGSPSIRRNRDKQDEPRRSPNNIQQDNKNGWVNQQQPENDYDLETINRLQELGKKRNPNAFQMHGSPVNEQNINQRGPNRQMQRDCCVAIRNAPNHTSYGDVRRFCPAYIDKHGIKMINDDLGRRTGNILVKFCEPRSKMIFLQRKNNELKGQQVMIEHIDDEAFDAAIDSYLPYRRDGAPKPEIPIVEETPEFTNLKLDELPFYIKEHDVMKVLGDYSLLSIVMKDNRSDRTRTAFVQFAKAADAQSALQHKEMFVFGRKQAVVTSLTEEEFEQEKPNPVIIPQPENPPPMIPHHNMSMFGMIPQNIPPAPLMERKLVDSPPPVAQTRDPRQRRNQSDSSNFPGQFGSQSIQNPFPQTGNGFSTTPFGGFPAQVRPVWGAPTPAPIIPNGKPNLSPTNDALDCILIKGLPQAATDRTIVEFLQETGSVPARIHLMLDATGARSGDCFCEFRSEEEARRATSRHGSELAGHRVTVDPVPRSVVEDALEVPRAPPALLADPPMFRAPMNDSMRGPMSNMHLPLDDMRPPIDDSYMIDDGYGPMDDFRGHRGSMYDRGRSRGRGKFDRGLPRGRGRGIGIGRGGRFERSPVEDVPTMEDFGAPGCVVSMENVPFRASVDDILQFFSEFDLTQEDVIRRFNDRGQPTGDARVAFKKPFDAQRAVKTRHLDTILDRRISLNII